MAQIDQARRDGNSSSAPISFIIPIYNESLETLQNLAQLQVFRQHGCEVIVVDASDGAGEAAQNKLDFLAAMSDASISSAKGRALQMNGGAALATGEILMFLHIDTLMPTESAPEIINSLLHARDWGRFDIRLSGQSIIFRVIEFMMNTRSRISGIATGDQGIFVRRKLFNRIGGYQNIALMEDIEISKRLKQVSFPECLKFVLTTSSRRWEHAGVIKVMVMMWRLRLLYFFGVKPEKLAQIYYG